VDRPIKPPTPPVGPPEAPRATPQEVGTVVEMMMTTRGLVGNRVGR
jgi:hypothetical protein